MSLEPLEEKIPKKYKTPGRPNFISYDSKFGTYLNKIKPIKRSNINIKYGLGGGNVFSTNTTNPDYYTPKPIYKL
jgi:hypothetical protein